MAAGGFLTELTGRETEDVPALPGDGDAGHVLVTAAQAGVGTAANDVPINPGDRAVARDDGSFAGAQSLCAAAAGEDGEVVRVLEIGAPGEDPGVQSRGE